MTKDEMVRRYLETVIENVWNETLSSNGHADEALEMMVDRETGEKYMWLNEIELVSLNRAIERATTIALADGVTPDELYDHMRKFLDGRIVDVTKKEEDA